MNKELLYNFYNKSTPEEKCQFLWLLANDIMIPIPKVDKDGEKYVEGVGLDPEIPVVMNGKMYQFNIYELYAEDREKENSVNNSK